jgi:hypothetical protein
MGQAVSNGKEKDAESYTDYDDEPVLRKSQEITTQREGVKGRI